MNLQSLIGKPNQRVIFAFYAAAIFIFGAIGTVTGQTLDAFNPNANLNSVSDLELLPDGKMLVTGGFSQIGGQSRFALARLNADGTLDTSFPNIFSNTDSPQEIIIQPDGKILVSGSFSVVAGVTRNRVVRLNADGTVDTTFDAGLTPPVGVFRIALQPDGKVIIPGLFGSNNTVIRRNADGSADSTFAQREFNGSLLQTVLQPDGKVLVCGAYSNLDGTTRNGVVRLNANGSLDTTFNANLNAPSCQRVLVAPDGKIYITGGFTSAGGQTRNGFARLNADGTADASFQDPNVTGGSPIAMWLLPNGKTLIGGNFTTVGGVARRGLARINADGSLDTTFRDMSGGSTAFNLILVIKTQPDGKILLGGGFTMVDGQTRNRLARITPADAPTARTKFDFDGDAKADLGVFRPANGGWYIYNLANGTNQSYAFGASTDKIVPADYDGDGKTDVAVYRDGTWYLNRSQLGFTGVGFGAATDTPVPADFDGDGKSELCVFRPSNGGWYLYNLATNLTNSFAFGQSGDNPVPADYDGDGRADIAVFRGGTWYIQRSQLGFTGIGFGAATDKPVPADYDGDGKTDVAVYRDGTWYLLQSTAGFTGITFGLATDKPVPADYDGDGKADVAVFRDGTWYLNRSTAGFTGVAFGAATDKPIPNAFVP